MKRDPETIPAERILLDITEKTVRVLGSTLPPIPIPPLVTLEQLNALVRRVRSAAALFPKSPAPGA